jgi:RraA family protein
LQIPNYLFNVSLASACPFIRVLCHCRDFGGNLRFSGQAATIKCFENNPLVRAALEEQGKGRVLVVDGGASLRCALLGDNIAEMAYKNGWSVSL